MISDMPTTYVAADFVRVYAYEPAVQKAFQEWYKTHDFTDPKDLVVTVAKNSITYTIKTLSSFLSYRETVDLIEVTSTVAADTPARFIASSNGNKREFSAANDARIISTQELRVNNEESDIVMYKSGSGEFLYFNIALL